MLTAHLTAPLYKNIHKKKSSNIIKQRLLENLMLTSVESYKKAQALKLAKVSSD